MLVLCAGSARGNGRTDQALPVWFYLPPAAGFLQFIQRFTWNRFGDKQRTIGVPLPLDSSPLPRFVGLLSSDNTEP